MTKINAILKYMVDQNRIIELGELSDAMGRTKQTVSRNLKTLEKNGWVEKVQYGEWVATKKAKEYDF